MKLSVSGWPGGGSSSLSLVLCKMLNIKHVRGGETFRYIYKQASFKDSGEDRVTVHNLIEPHIGPIIDAYIDYLIQSNDYNNFLIESDIAAFRVGKKQSFFSIFLLTDNSVRAKRMTIDGREDDGEVLNEVDKSHADTYMELHNISWFDLDEIREKHACVMDNSHMSIKEELDFVFEEMFRQGLLSEERKTELIKQTEQEDKDFWSKGKNWYVEYLRENNLVMDAQEFISNIKDIFPDDVEKLPEEIKQLLD